jgi:hypothetical protein
MELESQREFYENCLGCRYTLMILTLIIIIIIIWLNSLFTMLKSTFSGQVQSQHEYSINSNKSTQGQNKQIKKEKLNHLMLFKCKHKFRKISINLKPESAAEAHIAGRHFILSSVIYLTTLFFVSDGTRMMNWKEEVLS